ncbi:MAG: lipid-A-disaccharide synthase, partial [Chromatiales bacterium]|nr:lipid-A-disaccharide synthase [Chromatiales bacterium]
MTLSPTGERQLRVAIAAGETSGDALGAGLIQALKARCPGIQFEGIAGPQMLAAGCTGIYPMERLSVMGFAEVAGRYIGLMRDRRRLADAWLASPPDVFIGIDAPDFNLGLERRLKDAGIPTVHYVSPSVWAWRRYRLRGIRAAVSKMLTLFPFEARLYQEEGIDVSHVGHSLADAIAMEHDPQTSRAALSLASSKRWIALLPGSRFSEVRALADLMLESAEWLNQRMSGLGYVMPAATQSIHAYLQERLSAHPSVDVRLVEGDARNAMGAAEV